MPTAPESVDEGAGSQLASALAQGISTVSQGEVVTFQRYQRVVLPYDGFVFWVRADVIAPGAMLGGSMLNSFQLNQPPVSVSVPIMEVRPSSLHHTTTNQQAEDESFSVQKFTLTTQQPVDVLNAVAPDALWIGAWNGFKLAFSNRSGFYRAANTYHYTGDAVYPSLASQVIDFPQQLNSRDVVVSNSLPIWLTALVTSFPLFPSFLVPDNLPPPYGSVHIGDDDTEPLQLGPIFDATGGRWQLVRDTVRISTFGVRNDVILDWLDVVQDYSLNNPYVFGLMSTTIPRDAKRGQVEISALAQKKELTFRVSYYQKRLREVARQFIRRSFLESFYVDLSLATPELV